MNGLFANKEKKTKINAMRKDFFFIDEVKNSISIRLTGKELCMLLIYAKNKYCF